MVPAALFQRIIAISLLAAQANANVQLNFPVSTGYDANTEDQGPCGGVALNVTMSNMTFFNVGGGSIYLTSEHQNTDYLFRTTLDTNLEQGWTNVLPVIQQHGIGDFCLPSVPVLESYSGQTGVMQIIANTSGGTFFQCALLMFQPGEASKPQGGCTNGSSVFSNFDENDAYLNSIASSSAETFMSGSMTTSMSSMSSMSGLTMSTSSVSNDSVATASTTTPMSTSATALPTAALHSSNNSLGGGTIAGIVVGAVAGVAFVVFAVFCCLRRRRKGSLREKTSETSETAGFAGIGRHYKQPTAIPQELATEHSPSRGASPAHGLFTVYHPSPTVASDIAMASATTAVDSPPLSGAAGAVGDRVSKNSNPPSMSPSAVGSSRASMLSTDQIRAEIDRVKKQRQRLEEVGLLAERQEELERELEGRDV